MSKKIPIDELECEGQDCDSDPVWVADGEGMVPTFLCDDHRSLYPEESRSPIQRKDEGQ